MLEKPDIEDKQLMAGLQAEYSLPVSGVTFLPLGWDVHTAVYRVETSDGKAYFLKLRRGEFDSLTAELPGWLQSRGVPGIIAPVQARSGRLWGQLAAEKDTGAPADWGAQPLALILYPFNEGRNAYALPLDDRHWSELGAILRGVHTAQLPAALRSRLPAECYTGHYREMVRGFLSQAQLYPDSGDPLAAELVGFLRARRSEIVDLVQRAERLAQSLHSHPPELVLCHSDAHPGNLHLAADGGLYLVDWDNPILAPKELDLMFVGAGMGAAPDGRAYGEREEALFYQAYGSAQVNTAALAYFRYTRILVDIAEFCSQIFSGQGSEAERRQSLVFLSESFLPGYAIDIARRSDQSKR